MLTFENNDETPVEPSAMLLYTRKYAIVNAAYESQPVHQLRAMYWPDRVQVTSAVPVDLVVNNSPFWYKVIEDELIENTEWINDPRAQ